MIAYFTILIVCLLITPASAQQMHRIVNGAVVIVTPAEEVAIKAEWVANDQAKRDSETARQATETQRAARRQSGRGKLRGMGLTNDELNALFR